MVLARQTRSGISIAVALQPRASKAAVVGEHDGRLKLSVCAAPDKGRANKALIRMISDLFNTPTSTVSITAGKAARKKTVHIDGLTLDRAQQVLGSLLS